MSKYNNYVSVINEVDKELDLTMRIVEEDPDQVFKTNDYVFVSNFRKYLERFLSVTKNYENSYQEMAKEVSRKINYFMGEDVPEELVEDLANRVAQKVARFLSAIDDEDAISIMLNNIFISIGEEIQEDYDDDENDDDD